MTDKKRLERAKKEKNDEFYTLLSSIEDEILNHDEYIRELQGKAVYCNCDDYRMSNFYKFFHDNFNKLGLKLLIATNLDIGNGAYKAVYNGKTEEVSKLHGNGDCLSDECLDIVNHIDVIVTNPPFSIASKKYLPFLIKSKKKFIVVGSLLWITYKQSFNYFKNNVIQIGYNEIRGFKSVNGRLPLCFWITNFKLDKKVRKFKFTKTYKGNELNYPKYLNFNAIDCSKTKNIPSDYEGVIGVPISFMSAYNSSQFEIVGLAKEGLEGGLRTRQYKAVGMIFSNGVVTNTAKCISNVILDKIAYEKAFGKTKEVYYITTQGEEVVQLFTRLFIKVKHEGVNIE